MKDVSGGFLKHNDVFFLAYGVKYKNPAFKYLLV